MSGSGLKVLFIGFVLETLAQCKANGLQSARSTTYNPPQHNPIIITITVIILITSIPIIVALIAIVIPVNSFIFHH